MKYLNIGHFLTYAPLYKKAEIEITKFVNPLSLNDTTFDYYCISEEATKTHMLAIYPSVSSLDYTGPTWRHDIGKILDDQKGIILYINTGELANPVKRRTLIFSWK